jgi:hypothetical protein
MSLWSGSERASEKLLWIWTTQDFARRGLLKDERTKKNDFRKGGSKATTEDAESGHKKIKLVKN